ncbi:hypothetical protein AAFF_G00233380 [Aldrovandia affinis]|uniref:Uncharacterized protein n=1 Tax=Aldrovandia affinis TaxID=143900 RepID=A0AAD7W3K0_9TELE|nr:hypothetical protein AAFF_G00233380 [Aldrovandia affinis]
MEMVWLVPPSQQTPKGEPPLTSVNLGGRKGEGNERDFNKLSLTAHQWLKNSGVSVPAKAESEEEVLLTHTQMGRQGRGTARENEDKLKVSAGEPPNRTAAVRHGHAVSWRPPLNADERKKEAGLQRPFVLRLRKLASVDSATGPPRS